VNKFWCEWYHNITAEKLTCKVYNACLFDTAEKAKARETLCAAKKNLVAKLTCDVCKSCSFGTFEDAEAHEKTVLCPPLAQRPQTEENPNPNLST
jgi:hypothetical protein